MKNQKKSPRIENIMTKAKHESRQKAISKPVNPNIEVFFTVSLERHGIMKWLETKNIIKPRTQNIQIFMNSLGVLTYVSSVQKKNKNICALHNIKISNSQQSTNDQY